MKNNIFINKYVMACAIAIVITLVGVICILESICLFTGHDSVYDTIVQMVKENKELLFL